MYRYFLFTLKNFIFFKNRNVRKKILNLARNAKVLHLTFTLKVSIFLEAYI